MPVKKCSTCGEIKALDLFRKDRSQCKACRAASRAEYRRKNADEIEAYNAKYRSENAGMFRDNAAKHRKESPEKIKARQAEYYRQNAEKVKAKVAEWRRKNPEKTRAQEARKYKKHPEKCRARRHERRARLRGSAGQFTAEQIHALEKTQRNKCANPICRGSIKRGFHRDHMQPLALGGSNDIGNIQLLCPSCNLKKKAMPYEEWCRETGQLCFLSQGQKS